MYEDRPRNEYEVEFNKIILTVPFIQIFGFASILCGSGSRVLKYTYVDPDPRLDFS